MSTFEKAVEWVDSKKKDKNMTRTVTQEDTLLYYAYYKQATLGPCNKPAPSMWQVSEWSKWNAWNSIQKLLPQRAKERYVELAKKHGFTE
jgi:diazepam-binding inhibitor (GABA receptor modulating acyl-CoA-binding protein)